MMPIFEGEWERHVVVATQHLVKALGTNENLSDDLRRILMELDCHLSLMPTINDSKGKQFIEVEQRLKCAERKVMHWESNPALIRDVGPVESSEYLQAVNEILAVTETLGGLSRNEIGKQRELACQAQCTLQIAMSRLEEELCHILVQNKQFFELHSTTSLCSPAEDMIHEESFPSVKGDVGTSVRGATGRKPTEYRIDLVDPHAIPDIKSIARVMFASNYEHEFCNAFIGTRKHALEDYLASLQMDKFSIEDVLKLEWDILNSQIKKWVCAVKIIISVYLTNEKRLCEQILMDLGSVSSCCFFEISKSSILHLLNFGQAVAMSPRKPEMLFCVLDMYEVLADTLLDVEGLFSEEAGSFTRFEFDTLLRRLGESAGVTFLEFRNAIASDARVQPFPGGGVHHLTKYVMNHIWTLTIYCDTLNLILMDNDIDNSNAIIETDRWPDVSSSSFHLMACHLQLITRTLKSNLVEKSKLYKDDSLGHIFLMNNIHYMVQKVKSSDELQLLFGDEWIRKHNAKLQQLATSYVRTTWSSVVTLLSYDARTSLKERCKKFCNAFEEVYKSQTQWRVPDHRLREDLQISTSQKVIPAYRTFLGLNKDNVGDKYIKYIPDELEKMLLDLFVGSAKSLPNSRRR